MYHDRCKLDDVEPLEEVVTYIFEYKPMREPRSGLVCELTHGSAQLVLKYYKAPVGSRVCSVAYYFVSLIKAYNVDMTK